MWKEFKSNLLAVLVVSGIALGGAVTVTGSQFFTSITGGSASLDLVDAGQLYVANDATVAKTLRASRIDAGELNVVGNAQIGGALLVASLDAGQINTTARYLLNNGSTMIQESGGEIYLQAVATGGYWRCGNGACNSNVYAAAPIVDAGQLFVANNATVLGALRNGAGVDSATMTPVVGSNDAGVLFPRCTFGREVLAANAAIVSFNPAFSVLPACTCSHEAATPLACGPTAAATTTGVTFKVPTGSGTISWICCGPR